MIDTLSTACHDIWNQKLLTLRAVILGNAVMLFVWIVFAMRLADLDNWLFVTGIADIRDYCMGGKGLLSHFLIGV